MLTNLITSILLFVLDLYKLKMFCIAMLIMHKFLPLHFSVMPSCTLLLQLHSDSSSFSLSGLAPSNHLTLSLRTQEWVKLLSYWYQSCQVLENQCNCTVLHPNLLLMHETGSMHCQRESGICHQVTVVL